VIISISLHFTSEMVGAFDIRGPSKICGTISIFVKTDIIETFFHN
jgi:hypothetical protein